MSIYVKGWRITPRLSRHTSEDGGKRQKQGCPILVHKLYNLNSPCMNGIIHMYQKVQGFSGKK